MQEIVGVRLPDLERERVEQLVKTGYYLTAIQTLRGADALEILPPTHGGVQSRDRQGAGDRSQLRQDHPLAGAHGSERSSRGKISTVSYYRDLEAEVVAGAKESAEAGEEADEEWNHAPGFAA